MTSWTTIPPWLYRNDLPDAELQERYVEAAERKWAACAAHRDALEGDILTLRAVKRGALTAAAWLALAEELGERYDRFEAAVEAEAEARAFLEDARRALARYQPRGRLRRG